MNSHIKILICILLISLNYKIGFSQKESEVVRKSRELREKMRRIQIEGIESYNSENNSNSYESDKDVYNSVDQENSVISVKEDPWKKGKRQMFNIDNYPEFYEYKESSCYNELGWSPFVSKEVWDEKYARCEKKKMKNTLRAILFILFIIGGVGSGIYFGFYRKKKV